MPDLNSIQEHTEVVGSDGVHVGTVDNVGLKLTKTDPAANGQHHYLKANQIAEIVDEKIVLRVSGIDASKELKAVED